MNKLLKEKLSLGYRILGVDASPDQALFMANITTAIINNEDITLNEICKVVSSTRATLETEFKESVNDGDGNKM